MLAQKTAEGNIQETELERLRHALQSMAPTRLALIWLEFYNINIFFMFIIKSQEISEEVLFKLLDQIFLD